MEIATIIDLCHTIAKSKGFPVHKTLQQTLLIATEIGEALDALDIDINKTSSEFINYTYSLCKLSDNLEETRKTKDGLNEEVTIMDMDNYLEELADIVIRVFSIARHHTESFEDIIFKKIQYNNTRPMLHGKKF